MIKKLFLVLLLFAFQSAATVFVCPESSTKINLDSRSALRFYETFHGVPYGITDKDNKTIKVSKDSLDSLVAKSSTLEIEYGRMRYLSLKYSSGLTGISMEDLKGWSHQDTAKQCEVVKVYEARNFRENVGVIIVAVSFGAGLYFLSAFGQGDRSSHEEAKIFKIGVSATAIGMGISLPFFLIKTPTEYHFKDKLLKIFGRWPE